MHNFLRAIGFSQFTNEEEIDDFFKENFGQNFLVASYTDNYQTKICQYSVPIDTTMFLSVVGEQDDKSFSKHFYFPICKGDDATYLKKCTIQHYSEKEEYATVIEDSNVGLSIAFYLNNPAKYNSIRKNDKVNYFLEKTYLSALSIEGKVLLPIYTMYVNSSLEDEQNVEKEVGGLVENVDPYSIVESTIIPINPYIDRYLIIGEILSVIQRVNVYTDEDVYIIRVNVRGYIFPVCINKQDLVGIPSSGMRFKGIVWLQGEIVMKEVEKNAKRNRT